MKTHTFSPARSGSGRLPSLFTARTLWGIMVGALASVVVCLTIGLIGWQIGAYSRGLIIVWTLHPETAAWRGALLGLLVGWLSRTPKQMLAAFGIGTVALLAHDWKSQLSAFVPYQNVFDFAVVLHYIANALLVCTATYLLLLKHDRGIEQQRLKSKPESPVSVSEQTSAHSVEAT